MMSLKAAMKLGFECVRTHWNQSFIARAAVREIMLGGDVVGCGLAERAIRRGGHVRVGLEDWAGTGEPGNLDLLRDLTGLIVRLGHQPATIREARRLLGITGCTGR